MKSEIRQVQTVTAMDFQRWIAAEEGQFFERKSTWDRSGQHPRPRRTRDIAYDIAETLSAMANADGGEKEVASMKCAGLYGSQQRCPSNWLACCPGYSADMVSQTVTFERSWVSPEV